MTALDALESPVRRDRSNRTSIVWFLLAGVLLLGSAGLQLVAAIERWAVLSDSWTRREISIEDHLFDYSYPEDPWENLGSTAQFYGSGLLLLAVGILAVSRAVPRSTSAIQHGLVIVVAVSFASSGGHALISGVMGTPTVIQTLPLQSLLSLAAIVGLIVLAVRWSKHAWFASVACVFLVGNTMLGYLLAAVHVAPAMAGYQSHDTTPWTEAVVATAPGTAGLVLLIAAALGAARQR